MPINVFDSYGGFSYHSSPVVRPRAAHCPSCMQVPSRPRTRTVRARRPCCAVPRNALPRLHAGAPALAQSAPHTYASACTHKPRTEQLSIRVQATQVATHRPGDVPMPPQWKVSSSTTKDSNKGSSAGASSRGSQRAPPSFRASAQKSAKVAGGDAGMGQGEKDLCCVLGC